MKTRYRNDHELTYLQVINQPFVLAWQGLHTIIYEVVALGVDSYEVHRSHVPAVKHTLSVLVTGHAESGSVVTEVAEREGKHFLFVVNQTSVVDHSHSCVFLLPLQYNRLVPCSSQKQDFQGISTAIIWHFSSKLLLSRCFTSLLLWKWACYCDDLQLSLWLTN